MQGEDGKRISDLQQPSGNSDQTITEFDGYNYYEVDKVNIVKLGRRWFGEQFNIENEQDFNFNIPNIVTSKPVNLTVFTAASSFTRTSFEVKANNQSVGTILFSATGGATQADPEELNTSIPSSENIKITLKYDNNGVPDSKGYLDYILLKSKRNRPKLLPRTGLRGWSLRIDLGRTNHRPRRLGGWQGIPLDGHQNRLAAPFEIDAIPLVPEVRLHERNDW